MGYGWMDGWMNRWMDGQTDGRVDEWMDVGTKTMEIKKADLEIFFMITALKRSSPQINSVSKLVYQSATNLEFSFTFLHLMKFPIPTKVPITPTHLLHWNSECSTQRPLDPRTTRVTWSPP